MIITESAGQIVGLSNYGERLTRFMEQLRITHGLPKGLVLDNSPELTSEAMFFWSQPAGVKSSSFSQAKPLKMPLLNLSMDVLGRMPESTLIQEP